MDYLTATFQKTFNPGHNPRINPIVLQFKKQFSMSYWIESLWKIWNNYVCDVTFLTIMGQVVKSVDKLTLTGPATPKAVLFIS